MNARLPSFRVSVRLASGFSLTELLIVICVIGLMGSIALISVGKANEAARESVARRNAQTLVSVFSAGQAAGVNWGASDVESAVDNVFAGKPASDGAFGGKVFKVATIGSSELPEAKRYLRWDSTNSALFYSQTPST